MQPGASPRWVRRRPCSVPVQLSCRKQHMLGWNAMPADIGCPSRVSGNCTCGVEGAGHAARLGRLALHQQTVRVAGKVIVCISGKVLVCVACRRAPAACNTRKGRCTLRPAELGAFSVLLPTAHTCQEVGIAGIEALEHPQQPGPEEGDVVLQGKAMGWGRGRAACCAA